MMSLYVDFPGVLVTLYGNSLTVTLYEAWYLSVSIEWQNVKHHCKDSFRHHTSRAALIACNDRLPLKSAPDEQ
jgi:hypothetical protein